MNFLSFIQRHVTSSCVCVSFLLACILMTPLLNQQNSVQSELDERWRVREREVNEKMNEESGGGKDDMKGKVGKGGDKKMRGG